MSIDKRFALITHEDRVLYPYQKAQRATGRYGFALTRAGNHDRGGMGDYTTDIEEVVRRVVLGGWGVRARTEDRSLDGSYMLGKITVAGYWLAPELRHLVTSAPARPMTSLPGPGQAITNSVPSLLQRVDALNAGDFEQALLALEEQLTERQRTLLANFAQAPAHTASMGELARLCGYDNHQAANLQVGGVGKRFVDHFGITGLENQTQAIAVAGEEAVETGHWQWTLRPALVTAMARLGWVESAPEATPLTQAVQAEVDADPACAGLSPTQRVALVNARMGQGGYRKKMMRIWGGQCAVTGCAIDCALIASHAKAWKDSDNTERLDPYNGLLLAASVDRLFDQGLIAFSDQGQLLIGPDMDEAALASVGLSADSDLRFVHERHGPYLRAHRVEHRFEVVSPAE